MAAARASGSMSRNPTIKKLEGCRDGRRARRGRARITAPGVARVQQPAVGVGERYVPPGAELTAQRRTMHEEPNFLREIIQRLLRTGDWTTGGAVDANFLLWMGIDGIPPGLKISYVFVMDSRGADGQVWAAGCSPAAFCIACSLQGESGA